MDSVRKRQQRPCDNCRRRRIRCLFASEVATDCVLCVSRNTSCTYLQSAPTKKQSRKAEGAPARSRPTAGVARLDDDSTLSSSNLPTNSLLTKTLGHQNRQASELVGSSGDFDTSLALDLSATIALSTLKPPQILRHANENTLFIMTHDTPDDVAADFSDLDEIEEFVSPHGPDLVSLYFRIVHPSFPILHKKVFLEKHGRSYRELTPVGLGAVYVMALNWWSYSMKLADLPKPDARKLETKVLRMLFDAHRRPKISDLQGGLVLMQSPGTSSWAMTGHLISMAQNLGINADSTDWQVPDWERGVRKRVAWALYMQDKWAALIYGRGSHIHRDDWDVQPLTDTDFPETAIDDDDEEGSPEIEQGKQTFMHMVTLTIIVSRILEQFFTLRAARAHSPLSRILEQAKPIQLDLKAWHSNIPDKLSISQTASRKLSSVGYLYLAYYTAEVTLHRAIIRSCSFPQGNHDLMSIAHHAAAERLTASIAFVKQLKGEHLQSFWYFSSASSLVLIGLLAAMLHTASAHDAESQQVYLKQLAEYRWALRVSAKSADFIGHAISLLDARTYMLEEYSAQRHAALASTISLEVFLSPGDSEMYDTDEQILGGEVALQEPALPEEAWSQGFYDFNTPYPNLAWGEAGAYTPAG